MQITYAQLRNPVFIQAVKKISTAPMRSAKEALNLAKVVKVIEAEAKTAEAAFLNLVKGWGEVDAAANQVTIADDKVKEFEATYKDFSETSFSVMGRPVAVEALDEAKLSAAEIVSLGEIVAEE